MSRPGACRWLAGFVPAPPPAPAPPPPLDVGWLFIPWAITVYLIVSLSMLAAVAWASGRMLWDIGGDLLCLVGRHWASRQDGAAIPLGLFFGLHGAR